MLLLAAVLLTGAGDIGKCGPSGGPTPAAMATGRLLDAVPGLVFTLGDNAYSVGSEREFERCYDPAWGRHKARTRPSPGNHDYETPGARGYFAYFGDNAGDPKRGYYAYDAGTWRVYALNSSACDRPGGCAPDSPQVTWLRDDLKRHPSKCALAYWHHPRFSSGEHGDNAKVDGLWRAVADNGVDLVLTGHDHDYERFAPIDGVVSFVVGTGGAPLYKMGAPKPGSVARSGDVHGVLQLELHRSSYTYRFIPVPGSTFTDQGSGDCR